VYAPEELFRRHFASLCRTAFLLTGSASVAEEIVMEAFARSLPRWAAVENAEQPAAYLRGAVVNLCASRVRRLGAERRARERSGTSPKARWDAELADETRVVVEAVRRLPDRQRACVVLRYFEDLPEQDIARCLGCSIGTVKSQLAKARVRLATLLDPRVQEG
jgi:RNA polymerase sigma-70 factor (sigma-E family)